LPSGEAKEDLGVAGGRAYQHADPPQGAGVSVGEDHKFGGLRWLFGKDGHKIKPHDVGNPCGEAWMEKDGQVVYRDDARNKIFLDEPGVSEWASDPF